MEVTVGGGGGRCVEVSTVGLGGLTEKGVQRG